MPTSTTPDPSGRRPAFREGQLLDAPALQAEQQARSAALARHESQVHTTDERQLRAAAVTAPAGGSRIVLGGRGQLLSVQLADGQGGFLEAAAVHADGTSQVAGPATVTGPVTANGPAALPAAIPAPPGAAPWSLYRATVTAPGPPGTEQLRLETGEVKPGVNPAAVQALVTAGGQARASLLRVDANGTVTIPGQLHVTGNVSVSPGGAAAANTDLTASSTAVNGSSYTLELATSAATAVTSITVYQTVLSGGSLASRGTVAQGVSLQPASSTAINEPLPGGHVTVDVLAIGVGQDGRPRTATLSFTT